MTLDAIQQREQRQLSRLETLLDVMFALMLWRIVTPLPLPEPTERWSLGYLWDFEVANSDFFLSAGIGVIIIVIYWAQSNALLGNLARSDAKHAATAIAQIVFLMLYGYSIRLSELLPGIPGPYILQSLTLAGVGFSGVLGWNYAMKNRRLLSEAISDQGALDLRLGVLPEPVTALLTIPFAFLGGWAWNLSWLLYIPVAALLRRRRRSGKDDPAAG